MNIACSDCNMVKGNDAGNNGLVVREVVMKCDEMESNSEEENSDEAEESCNVQAKESCDV